MLFGIKASTTRLELVGQSWVVKRPRLLVLDQHPSESIETASVWDCCLVRVLLDSVPYLFWIFYNVVLVGFGLHVQPWNYFRWLNFACVRARALSYGDWHRKLCVIGISNLLETKSGDSSRKEGAPYPSWLSARHSQLLGLNFPLVRSIWIFPLVRSMIWMRGIWSLMDLDLIWWKCMQVLVRRTFRAQRCQVAAPLMSI